MDVPTIKCHSIKSCFVFAFALFFSWQCFVIFLNQTPFDYHRKIIPERTRKVSYALTTNLSYDRCSAIRLGYPGSLPLIALASYPRSGNTWTRRLIQKATGLYTGCVYWAVARKFENARREFVGGVVDYKHQETICVKTHRKSRDEFEAAILLIRNPYRSIVSEVFRRQAGMIAKGMCEEVKGYFRSEANDIDTDAFNLLHNDTIKVLIPQLGPRLKFMQQFHKWKKEDVRAIMHQTEKGKRAVQEITNLKACTPKNTHILTNMCVDFLVSQHGLRPGSDVKEATALAVIRAFPFLRDPEGQGHEEWFIKGKGKRPSSGRFENRLKYVRRISSPRPTVQEDDPTSSEDLKQKKTMEHQMRGNSMPKDKSTSGDQ